VDTRAAGYPGGIVATPVRKETPLKRSVPFVLASLLAGFLAATPAMAAPASRAPRKIQLTYHGGPLLQNVQVATLYWGADWKDNALTGYFEGFFKALFADGRYLANLSQYDVGDYKIGTGALAATTTDDQTLSATVRDSQIRAQIRAQIAAGHLPAPTENTVYFVFTPPHTVVVSADGADSANDFAGYHDYATGSDPFAYAVIPYADYLANPRDMTEFASHELAEAITDPEPVDGSTLGWYDSRNGEVGDIPVSLYAAQRITRADLMDELTAPDGTVYRVQKEWSNQDNAPVAFAATGP
jgi:hypothetical protein